MCFLIGHIFKSTVAAKQGTIKTRDGPDIKFYYPAGSGYPAADSVPLAKEN